MRNYRWLSAIIIIQILSALIVINRPSGSDWIVFILLLGSSVLSIEALARLRGWDWSD
jgi:hypothetical protein